MADSSEKSDAGATSRDDDTPISPLVLGVPIVFGLVLVGVVLWLVFGQTGGAGETKGGLRDLASQKERRKLTKEEFTVIAADDAAASDGESPSGQEGAAQKGQKTLDRTQAEDESGSKASRPAAGDRK